MAVSRELRQYGAQTATFWVDGDGASTFLRYQDWLKLPQGKLRTFLTSTFVDGGGLPDAKAAMKVFADAGGSLVSTVAGSVATVRLDVYAGPADEEYGPVGTPMVYVDYSNSNGNVVRISTSYSASE